MLGCCVARGAYALVPQAPTDAVPVRLSAFDELPAVASMDYGAFRVALIRPSAATTRFGTRSVESAYGLHLGGRRFDPAREPATDRSGLTSTQLALWSDQTPGDQLHLLQFAVPVRSEWQERLEGAGLKVIRALVPNALIVWGDHEPIRLPELERWLRSVAPFHASYRLLPHLRSLPAGEPLDIRVLHVRAAGRADLVRALEALGGSVTSTRAIDTRLGSISLAIDGALLSEVAALPGVYSVHDVPTDGGLRSEISTQIHAGNVDGSNYALTDYSSWLAGLPSGTEGVDGLSGAGVDVAIVDSGVDLDHPDLIARMASCTGDTCQTSVFGSHGSQVASIVAGDGASAVTETETATSRVFLRGQGVAPGAQMIPQRFTLGSIQELMQDSSINGAVVSNNSWGPADTPQGYDDDTLQADIGVRDANPDLAGNQPLTYVLAIMNGEGGTSSQGSPDEAKNLITVGSTHAQASPTQQETTIDDISDNSAHGPTLDLRFIPHLVATGCKVDSANSSGGHGLSSCGTSFAAPHVAGTVALFVEQFRNGYGTDPSPALIKAALLATARSLVGHLDADGNVLGHPPDSKQGWGRADPATLLDPPAAVAFVDQTHLFDGPGEEFEIDMVVDDPDQPVRIMLVWTDAPGHGLGGATDAWNNDLDLEVEEGANTYLGNEFSGGAWSTTGGSPDPMNNTEGVFLATDAGRSSFTVRVVAADINSDGVPAVGDPTDQDFAIYCLNCRAEKLFSDGFESGDPGAWQ